MVIFGVVLATVGELEFTTLGFILTFLGVVLSSLKGMATNLLLIGNLKLHPFDLLRKMAVLSFFQCLVIAFWCGEVTLFMEQLEHNRAEQSAMMGHVIQEISAGGNWVLKPANGKNEWVFVPEEGAGQSKLMATGYSAYFDKNTKLYLALLVNGLLAFLLNFVSFTANKKTSALSMTVAGNVKQAMSIVLSVVLFGYVVTSINGFDFLLQKSKPVQAIEASSKEWEYDSHQTKKSLNQSALTTPQTLHYNDYYETLHEIAKNKVLHPFYINKNLQCNPKLLLQQDSVNAITSEIEFKRNDSAYMDDYSVNNCSCSDALIVTKKDINKHLKISDEDSLKVKRTRSMY
ncbi:UAA transporter [Clydaea vesicula]|uniref:UAA transporter n=1 Tax=Clydaea vesicula TaxID=447962 RepID=A0AAD5TXD6_9FUNG|nr:UAA transporter [Clydaea vesicula]